jgi:NCAIR mutase (PurE)-related protein
MGMAEIEFDFQRRTRIGIAEAVLCAGKTVAQVRTAVDLAAERGAALLLTRLEADLHELLAAHLTPPLDYDPLSRTAIVGPWAPPVKVPEVAIVTAGTSDLPVAHEARRTLAFHGVAAEIFADCGVAGLWRLLRHEAALRNFPVVIACAGMEGALFSVIGGLVPGLVIAVPTSVGYGAAEGGRTALGAALVSCAPGVLSVNIDNGYGAACGALRALGALSVSGRASAPGAA